MAAYLKWFNNISAVVTMSLRLRARFGGDSLSKTRSCQLALKDATTSPSHRRNSSLTVDYGVRTPVTNSLTSEKETNSPTERHYDYGPTVYPSSDSDSGSDSDSEEITDEEYDRRYEQQMANLDKFTARLLQLTGQDD